MRRWALRRPGLRIGWPHMSADRPPQDRPRPRQAAGAPAHRGARRYQPGRLASGDPDRDGVGQLPPLRVSSRREGRWSEPPPGLRGAPSLLGGSKRRWRSCCAKAARSLSGISYDFGDDWDAHGARWRPLPMRPRTQLYPPAPGGAARLSARGLRRPLGLCGKSLAAIADHGARAARGSTTPFSPCCCWASTTACGAWKGFDWAALDRLHHKGFISNPVGKAKSVVFTDEGLKRAETLFEQDVCQAAVTDGKRCFAQGRGAGNGRRCR